MRMLNISGSLLIVHKRSNVTFGGGNHFDSTLWIFGPCVMSFQNICCSLLTIDWTHLLCKYQGVLLVACGLDGNNKFLSIAYVVVGTKRYETWEWFYGKNGYRVTTILSDK